jgi:hypothetical protein
MQLSWKNFSMDSKLTLALAFALQLATIVWWASALTEKVQANATQIQELKSLEKEMSQLRTELALTRQAIENI